MRKEFSQKVKVAAFERANGKCEGTRPDGQRCVIKLHVGKFQYDHIVAANLGGDNSLENCAVLCLACHGEKTTKLDTPIAAKVKRIHAKHVGAKPKRPWNPGWRKPINGPAVRRT